MRTIKLTIEYDGTDFRGWQKQNQGERTVQGEIESALTQILQEPISITGAGRTDTGVHALGQVAHFKTRSDLAITKIPAACNANIGDDVVVLKADEIADDFHAQYSAREKRYRYTIIHRDVRPALERHRAWHIYGNLNFELMRSESQDFIGTHDFKSFQSLHSSNRGEKDTFRTISELTLKKTDNTIVIEIQANGFLYKMVRNIVGLLVDIGLGRVEKDQIRTILAQKDRKSAGSTAQAAGLKLLEIYY